MDAVCRTCSPDNDYDVRFIYVKPLEWYLRVGLPRDVIELPIDDELDISGWALRKALHLLRKSNPTLLAVRGIDAGRGVPPMRFADLVAATVDDSALLVEINDLLALKMQSNESKLVPRRPAIHAFIEAELARAEHCLDYKKPQGDTTELDKFLFEVVTGKLA